MIGAWLILTAVLNVAVPQLEEIAGRDASPVVPVEASSQQSALLMEEIFNDSESKSVVVVAMERTSGLTPQDRRYAEALVPALSADPEDVAFVQDLRDPALRRALTSSDRQARYLLVGVTGATGAPASLRQVEAVREIVRENVPDGLAVLVTGPTATVVDATVETERSVLRITIVTIFLIGLILLLVYRSWAITALILSVVGIGLALGRAVVALCGLEGVFTVSTFSGSFMTAVVLGAGTDYAVFLVARYHEQRRLGLDPPDAAAIAASKVGSVIAGSALTVVLATSAMGLAQIGFFTTTGPAVAVAIAANLGISIMMTTSLIVLAARRGWAEPRDGAITRRWERLSTSVARRPVRVAVAALIPLGLMTAALPFMTLSYDFREPLPDDVESNRGYELMARHFPVNEVLPDYVLIEARRDLRTSAHLALIERVAATLEQQPGVDLVRTVTRPDGTEITQASLAGQSGRVGSRLAQASDEIADGAAGADQLADGAGQVAEGAGTLADGADLAAEGAERIVRASGRLASGLARLLDGADQAAAGTGGLAAGARSLADGLAVAADQVAVAVDGLGQVVAVLENRSLTCSIDPACRQARAGLKKIWLAERDQLLPGLRKAASGARRLSEGTGSLADGLERLRDGLAQARTGTAQLVEGQRTFADRLGDLADGADQLADGTDQVATATGDVASGLPQLERGLARVAQVLRTTDRELGDDPLTSGFYLPPAALETRDFRKAGGLFVSDDGRVVRLAVLGATDAFGDEASDRARNLERAVTTALRGTALEDSVVSVNGIAATNADLRDYVDADLRTIAIGALLAVFLVLLLLLRSPVAAGLLMATVVLSWAAALGASALIWEFGLGIPLDWTVAAVSLVILVAVGADYNLLLTKRMHEEAPDGSRAGIARATAATGSVITTAGLIFAVSMLALLAGRVTTVGQSGSTIAIGLLLDTFVVRTLLVPALAAILGPRLWWPRNRLSAEAVEPMAPLTGSSM